MPRSVSNQLLHSFLFCLTLLAHVPAFAQFGAGKQVQAELLAEYDQAAPGTDFWVVLQLRHEPNWHSYWPYPSHDGTGFPTSIEWTLPPGVSAGKIQWPTPDKFLLFDAVNYGYHGETLLPVKITLAKDVQPGAALELKAAASWLACEKMCIPGAAELALKIKIGETPKKSAHAEIIAAAVRRLPAEKFPFEIKAKSFSADSGTPNRFTAALEWDAAQLDAERFAQFAFFPLPAETVLLDATPELKLDSGKTTLLWSGTFADGARPDALQIKGVFKYFVAGNAESLSCWIDETVAAQGAPAAAASPADAAPDLKKNTDAGGAAPFSFGRLLFNFLLAMLGGLILNVMPCVLPVISLKAFSLERQARESHSRLILLSVCYTFGVLASFWLLAAVMIAFRALGHGANWGLLFQIPEFVVFLSAVVFVFALSLLGVYEISAPGGSAIQGLGKLERREGPVGSFFTGVLATLLATPCTAPVLGTAVGFALTGSNATLIVIFTGIGLGLAAPFLLLGFFPAWTRYIPKAGAWTVRFKQFIGILLLGTLVWLIGVMIPVAGFEVAIATLWFLFLLGIGCWLLGAFIDLSSTAKRKNTVRARALFLAVFGYCFFVHPALYPGIEFWEDYSQEKFDRLRAQNKIVFLDFTAVWCVNCKVNERLILKTAAVEEKLRAVNAVPLVVDFSRRDPLIKKMIEDLGGIGVPLYAIYPPERAAPIVLPAVITRQLVIDKLQAAAAAGRTAANQRGEQP